MAKYVPTEANETFDIMNLLEDRLQHANSAVVLATIKVFLNLTMSMADVHQQVKKLNFSIYEMMLNNVLFLLILSLLL